MKRIQATAMKNTDIIHEVAPISDRELLYIVERHKSEFNYPLHTHEVGELNFIRGGDGLKRIVGDSIERVKNLEMTLITQPGLEHCWEQADCTATDMEEITIQFSLDIIPETLLKKNQFSSIHTLLQRAQCGIAFSEKTILEAYSKLQDLLHCGNGFSQVLHFVDLINHLSMDTEAHTLASNAFAKANVSVESRQAQQILTYIQEHLNEPLNVHRLAEIWHMSDVTFTRFFKQQTSRTVIAFVTDARIAAAARKLVNTDMSISEIAYQCGFNNLSNFNRLFLKSKHMSPKQYRTAFQKRKTVL